MRQFPVIGDQQQPFGIFIQTSYRKQILSFAGNNQVDHRLFSGILCCRNHPGGLVQHIIFFLCSRRSDRRIQRLSLRYRSLFPAFSHKRHPQTLCLWKSPALLLFLCPLPYLRDIYPVLSSSLFILMTASASPADICFSASGLPVFRIRADIRPHRPDTILSPCGRQDLLHPESLLLNI